MTANTTLHRIDPGEVARSLSEARPALDQLHDGELLLDFSAVHRIDTAGVRALGDLVTSVGDRTVRLTARAVCVSVYKVLKLTGLADRLSFMS
jgi:anti-anti-sigma regulatory factor